MVPLAEKPDFNGNRHYAFVLVFLLADPITQRLHPVLQPLAFTHTHAEPHGKTDSLAQPHGHAFVPVCLHSDPFSNTLSKSFAYDEPNSLAHSTSLAHFISLVQPHNYPFRHTDTHGNAPAPHPFHLPADRCR